MKQVFNIKDKLEYLKEIAVLEHNEWSNEPHNNFEICKLRSGEKLYKFMI